MKKMSAIIIALIMVVVLLFSGCGNSGQDKNVKHQALTEELIQMLDKDPELKTMMEESLAAAAKINPNEDTNPAQDLDSLYTFLDYAYTCMPWNVLKDAEYPTLYDHIDQCVDYFWFLVDQPLPELSGKNYYYPSLQYHEPIASWCRKYADTWGDYLDTEDSWNDEYYKMFCESEDFNMDKGWYAEKNIWKTWNEYFARHLVSKDVRPIGDTEVVAPADSTPQGVWKLNKDGAVVGKDGVVIKSQKFSSAASLIGPGSDYNDEFKGGTLTHTFLDVNDYHRYHFPVSGKVVEVRKIKGTNAAGGVTIWDEENERYRLLDTVPGWQMIETRDCVILDTKYGLVAILPIGMSQICSCNFEDTVKVGATVEKGDPMGYFLFGGSDIVMLFQSGVDVDYKVPKGKDGSRTHVLMGEEYAKLKLKK